jgi:hypothetical protein
MRFDLSAALCAGMGAAVSSVVAKVRSRDAAVTSDPDPRGCERCRLLTHAGCAWGLEQTCANPSPWCWPQPDELEGTP